MPGRSNAATPMRRSRHVSVRIDLARVRANAQDVKRRVGTGVAVIAVVKADAYGLGAARVADALADVVDEFCVFSLDEAAEADLLKRTGKPILANVRLPGTRQFYASPIFAGGRVYFIDRDGVSLVLKPGSQLNVLATNKLVDPVDASPVAVGKQLVFRGERFLYCIEGGE